MNSAGESLSSVAQSHMAMHQKTAERNAAVVHAFCLLASIMFCYRACTLCSLLRTLIFPGPYFWGWLVDLCLKSRGTLFFALCSANSRKLLTRALCPGFKACNAPADVANCHCVPANLLSRSLHPCKVVLHPNLSRQHVYSTVQNHSAIPNLRQLHSAAIGLQPSLASVTLLKTPSAAVKDFARTITCHPVNSNTNQHSMLQSSAPRQRHGQITHAD